MYFANTRFSFQNLQMKENSSLQASRLRLQYEYVHLPRGYMNFCSPENRIQKVLLKIEVYLTNSLEVPNIVCD